MNNKEGNNNERPAEVKKTISAEPTIHEEAEDEPRGVGGGHKSSIKGSSGGSWRRPFNNNNRRKSVELMELPHQQQNQTYQGAGGGGGNNRFNVNNKNQQQYAAAAQSAKDRRRDYVRANSHRGFTSVDHRGGATDGGAHTGFNNAGGGSRGPRNGVTRSMSTNQTHCSSGSNGTQAPHLSQDEDNGALSGGQRRGSMKKRNRCSTSAGKRRFGSNSINSMNGESFDYDEDIELDEPFSDSEEESPRAPAKPCLVVPRGRIRTLSGTVPPVGYSPKWGGPTMCLSCLQFFDLPDQIGKFADHLLVEHKIVVVEMDLIVDSKRYIEHWRQRFAKQPVDKIFPRVNVAEDDVTNPYHGKTDYYFEMSERIPEDYSLRQRLAMRRLEEALACQQREREEICFSMQCIFCRYVARGNRAKLIHHLYMIHHLNLGSPDNLVFVAEYIDHLKDKLQRNECIYCEKIFSDRTVLMDHMRKRNHREVNPKNNYYDKFYIINYLELGKRWLDVLAEDFEDTMPTFADSDDEEEEESWHEWQEDNTDEDQIRAVCLFCNFNAEKIFDILEHSKMSHSFDLLKYIADEKMDVYARMKFLNYVRKQASTLPKSPEVSGDSPKPIVLPEREQWDVEENLVPMYGNDHLPWMLESHLEEIEEAIAKSRAATAAAAVGEAVDPERAKTHSGEVSSDWDCVNATFAHFIKRQTSIESTTGELMELSPAMQNSIIRAFIDASKANTVEELVAFCKALSKAEAPLKQKHVRALIVGTHRQRSARIFWHAVSRVQLEKNPLLTWKFCHLLHKLIRDGHRKVTEDSFPHCNRIVQLGNFWQHLRTSGYGMANTTYCKLLVSRLQFHHKYPSIVGSLSITSGQMDALTADMNESYELAIDMLDQMDELIGLKITVMNIMESFRWSSLVPQGQCLLAPLILVILDTSKFYDFLVKVLFRLHSRLALDTLIGHRERFYEIFRKTRKFYEDAGSLQYFKYLVSIPTLPAAAPNFLHASDLDSYQTPQAYLRADGNSESGGDATPPDAQSVCEDIIVDLSTDESTVQQLMQIGDDQQSASGSGVDLLTQTQQQQEMDQLVETLRGEVNAERQCKERLLNEARIRIEQYEARLVQMEAQIEARTKEVEARDAELARVRVDGDTNAQTIAALQQQLAERDQKFGKLKAAYEMLRQEHITTLTELRDLRAAADARDVEQLTYAAQLAQARQELESMQADANAKSAADEASAADVGSQLEEEMRRMDAAIQQGVRQIEELQRRARENFSGVRLEVNDRILEQCTSLMIAVRKLVARSRDVQEEIIAAGRGFGTVGEFYKRNHLWTEGLLSAASAVGVAATVLVNSADGMMSGKSKFEHLIVAAQEIGASVAQLFVSSRVKADKNSAKIAELASASKEVNTCTAAVVAASKSAKQTLTDEKLMDFTRLSLHDAKKEEMESQVRTLELEAQLDRERAKLAQLRKQHYHLASLVTNNGNSDNNSANMDGRDGNANEASRNAAAESITLTQ